MSELTMKTGATPEDIAKAPRSHTGTFLKPVLAKTGGKRKRGEAAE